MTRLSYSRDESLECPECQRTFERKLWLVVDKDEAPGEWSQCRIDTIHCMPCDDGHAHRIQKPLLLHDSTRNRLIYSPAPPASHQQAAEDLNSLMQAVWTALPKRIRNVKSAFYAVTRDLVPLAMAGLDRDAI